MFDGPQQRARAELLKAFPRATKPRTQSQQLADLALAELRQAQAKRATAQATEVEPARAESFRQKAAVSKEKAEARSQDKSITQSIIDKNLAMAKRALRAPRFRGSGNTAKRMRNTEIENARRAAEREIKSRFSTKDIDAEQNKTTTQIQRLQAAASGTVANPGKGPDRPTQRRAETRRQFAERKKAFAKENASYLKRKSEYDKDQNRKKQVANTVKALEKRQAELNKERRSRLKSQQSALRKQKTLTQSKIKQPHKFSDFKQPPVAPLPTPVRDQTDPLNVVLKLGDSLPSGKRLSQKKTLHT